MFTIDWKKRVFKLHQRAKAEGASLEVDWQDHFYSSQGQFGYPITVRKTVHGMTGSQVTIIVAWATQKATSGVMSEMVQEYVDSLGVTNEQ